MREFTGALRDKLDELECRAAHRRLADECNSWGGGRRETADRMHCQADGTSRHLMMGRLILVAWCDRYAPWREAEMLGAVGSERPGERHACRVMERRDERLQQKHENGKPSGSP